MFTITSTRIVGLIAVVCAVIVAPQALAMRSIDSQDATATVVAPPAADQGYDLSGLDLSILIGIRGYEHQDQYLKGLALAALAGGAQKSVMVQPDSQWQSPMGQPANNTPGGIATAGMFVYMPTNPGWGAAATAAKKSAARPAPEPAVKTAPVVCNGQAEYDYVYSGCEWWN